MTKRKTLVEHSNNPDEMVITDDESASLLTKDGQGEIWIMKEQLNVVYLIIRQTVA